MTLVGAIVDTYNDSLLSAPDGIEMSIKKWMPVALIAIIIILIDQIAKLWVVNNVVVGQTIPILESLQPYLQITRTTNTGFAFGLATGGSTIILILSSVVTLVLLWMVSQTEEAERLQLIAFSLVIGGAVGNIIDRIRLGHVVDFVHVYIPGLISNVSNFADHFVVIGVGLLLLDGFLQEHRKSEDTDASSQDETVTIVEE